MVSFFLSREMGLDELDVGNERELYHGFLNLRKRGACLKSL